MNKFTTKIRHASPSILTGLSIAGVVGTTVMAVRATPKALQLIKDKKDELDTDHLKPMEVAQTSRPRLFMGKMQMTKSMQKWRKMRWCLHTIGAIRSITWIWIQRASDYFFMIFPQRSISEPQWQRC